MPAIASAIVVGVTRIGRTCRDSSVSMTLTGMVNQNTDPTPSSDWTPMAPPMSLTNWREIDKPSPVPPNRLVDELSACWKGTNSRSTSLRGGEPVV